MEGITHGLGRQGAAPGLQWRRASVGTAGGTCLWCLGSVPPELLLLLPSTPGLLHCTHTHLCICCWQCSGPERGRCLCCSSAVGPASASPGRDCAQVWGSHSQLAGRAHPVLSLLAESRPCVSLVRRWHPPGAMKDPRCHGCPFGVSREVFPHLPSLNTSGKPQPGLPASSTTPGQGIHPSPPRAGGTEGLAQWGQLLFCGGTVGGPLPLTPLWSLGEGRSAAGVCQACAPSPGHVSWGWGAVHWCTPGEQTGLVKTLQGFLWVWEGPRLGQCSHAGVFQEFHGLAHALL